MIFCQNAGQPPPLSQSTGAGTGDGPVNLEYQRLQELLSTVEAECARLRRERDAARAALALLLETARDYRAAQQAAKEAWALAELSGDDAQDREAALRKVGELMEAQARLFAAIDAVDETLKPPEAGQPW